MVDIICQKSDLGFNIMYPDIILALIKIIAKLRKKSYLVWQCKIIYLYFFLKRFEVAYNEVQRHLRKQEKKTEVNFQIGCWEWRV